jgi:YfiH family protein
VFFTEKGLEYYSFSSFPEGVTQAVFTRKGGTSQAPWDSLNMGSTVGDDLTCVRENKRRALSVLNRPFDSVYDVWQVHGDAVLVTDEPRPHDVPHPPADGIITQNPEVTLMMRFADCVPMFLYDPTLKVIGLVHAGWQGTVNKVVGNAIQTLIHQFKCNPVNIYAGMGPSICCQHYPVGQNVVDEARKVFSNTFDQVVKPLSEQMHFDLWAANAITIREYGVTNLEISEICTICDEGRWFSHRRDHAKTGRFGAAIALNGK